jgi:hypothetical protein
MYRKLLKTVTNLGSPRVLLVGDFMLDSYIYGDALRISPEAPVQVLKVVVANTPEAARRAWRPTCWNWGPGASAWG